MGRKDLVNPHLYAGNTILQFRMKYTAIQVNCNKTLVLNFRLLKAKHLIGTVWYLAMEPNYHARFRNPARFLASLSTWLLCSSLRQKTLAPSTARRTQEFLETTMMPAYDGKLPGFSYSQKFDKLINTKSRILRTLARGNLNLYHSSHIWLLLADATCTDHMFSKLATQRHTNWTWTSPWNSTGYRQGC